MGGQYLAGNVLELAGLTQIKRNILSIEYIWWERTLGPITAPITITLPALRMQPFVTVRTKTRIVLSGKDGFCLANLAISAGPIGVHGITVNCECVIRLPSNFCHWLSDFLRTVR